MKNPVSIDWERVILWMIVLHLLGEQYDWFPAGAVLIGYGIAVASAVVLWGYFAWELRGDK